MYTEFNYHQPAISAEEAARTAISILEAIANLDESAVVYFLDASNILLLAGLRAQSPYKCYPPRLTKKRFRSVSTLLAGYGIHIVSEEGPYWGPDRRPAYSLFNESVMNKIPVTYPVVANTWISPIKYTTMHVTEVAFILERRFADSMEAGELPIG